MNVRAKVAWELGVLTVLAVAFLLAFPRRSPFVDFALAGCALAGIGITASYTRRTVWASLPTQPEPDATRRGWRLALMITGSVAGLFLVIGFGIGFQKGGWSGAATRLLNPGMLLGFLFYLPWALVQQTLFQFYLLGRLVVLLRGRAWLAIGLAGGAYSLVHLPDYATTAATAVSGIVWSWIYFRYRRLLPLALSHAALGSTFYYWVCGQNLAAEWSALTPGLPAR